MKNHNKNLNPIDSTSEAQKEFNPVVLKLNNIKNKRIEQLNLSEVIEKIQDGSFEDKIQEIRNYDKNLKINLPSFIFNNFTNNEIKNDKFLSTETMVFDIDHVGADKVVNLKKKLKEDPSVFLAFRSPSGDGVKFFIKINELTDIQEYKKKYTIALKHFEQKLGVKLDGYTKDPARLTFFSHDPDCYMNLTPANFDFESCEETQKINSFI